ncbi:hypothetical protein EWM64_g3481 [Hericium alpestre]|uniref:DNA ligase n=1 Tax=Hericium alpestre TaxID=135208 RepID=A0A4Z0A263_9AGAM|nr:hypothetical protein EWM64_g3481 [Hericium alpestre]
MNISVKETTVFSVFHPDAHDLFNTCSDLKKVAWELWDPARRLNNEEKAVQLFHAFAPMLCKRPTRKIEETVKEMGGRTFIIEEKLDGERMQLHRRGNEYFYCSRKGKDYTYLYGSHIGTGSLTPFIDEAFDERVEEIIVDGEMLVWDPVSERNLPFGTLKTAALDKSNKELNPRPCFKIFDLLYLNGMSLLNKSVKFRKRNLKSCVKEVHGRIEYVIEFEGKTAQDVRKRMEDIMADRGEGLIIKHPQAEYVLNGRNRDWIKVKPEYMDNMGETVDVLVVGGNYGSGRRGGGVSSLICAVLDDRHVKEGEEPKYSTFVRTAHKSHEDKAEAYLEPEESFIVKVKAAEITPSVVSSDPKSRTRDADRQELLKEIRANGGAIAQVARGQEGLYVVYGGTTTPHDIKSAINKGHEVIKPQWIRDSILAGERRPMTKRYFFHASDDRKLSDEYNQDVELFGEEEAMDVSRTPSIPPAANGKAQPAEEEQEEKEEMEPTLKEWIQVRGEERAEGAEEESVTDPDSENEDVLEPLSGEDEWLTTKAHVSGDVEVTGGVSQLDVREQAEVEQPHVKMGEEDTAMAYDEELIFRHLAFYLDSPENARKNGMTVKSTRHEADITKSFDLLKQLITSNGGRVVELDDPKLTHVVLDKRDDSRRRELIARTSKPKRRNLVLADYIQACLDEETLLDEAEFAP